MERRKEESEKQKRGKIRYRKEELEETTEQWIKEVKEAERTIFFFLQELEM